MARADIACLSISLLPPRVFFANFEIENVAKKFPKHEANLVEFTLKINKNPNFSQLVFFFFFGGMKKVTKFVKKYYWVVRVRYYVLLLSYWIMEEGLGGSFWLSD
jgi:hypothetical protein